MVSVKIPEFMESAVNGWFSILEVQFHLQNVVTPKTKFHAVVMSLPAETVAKLLIAPLKSQDYEEVKHALIEAHKNTKPKLLKKN